MENVVLEGLWTGIGSMLANAWPILALLLVLNLAKPYLKKKRRRSNKKRSKLVGFFERITPAVSGGPTTANNQIRNEPEEMFKAGDILPDFLAEPKKSERNYSEDLMDQGDAYVARKHLMSPTERSVL